MKIELKNIGKIRSASVDLDGITVIAGENNTGKSTVSKALYSSYKTLYDAHTQIREERLSSIRNSLSVIYMATFSSVRMKINLDALAKNIFDNPARYSNHPENLKAVIKETLEKVDEKRRINVQQSVIDDNISSIQDALDMEDTQILTVLAKRNLENELNGQIINIYSESAGEIKLFFDSTPCVFQIDADQRVALSAPAELTSGIIYLDDPFDLDNLGLMTLRLYPYENHRYDLQSLLRRQPVNSAVDEIRNDELLSSIFQKINDVCAGEIISSESYEFKYRMPGAKKTLDVRNLSAGLKSFAILKTLLRNRTIESGSAVILDEPEIHLHPEWQLVFAELIVLLRKEFNLNIMLTTHSPYFLEAIEAYSAKHNIKKDCKYYLAYDVVDSLSEVLDVTGNLDRIYKQLAAPIKILAEMEDGDD